MEYEDDYSYSEDNQYSNYENYSIYSNDFQVEHQANFSFSEEQIDSFDKLLQLHFSQYTPEEISTYIRSLETITLITLIRNSTDPHLIKSSITFLQTELDQFFHSRKRGINTSHITNTENLKFINYTKSVPQQSALGNESKFKCSITPGKVEPFFHIEHSNTSVDTQSQSNMQNSLAKNVFYEFSPYVSSPARLKAGIAYYKQSLMITLTDPESDLPPTEELINESVCEILGYSLEEIFPARTKKRSTISIEHAKTKFQSPTSHIKEPIPLAPYIRNPRITNLKWDQVLNIQSYY
jgi:hypothetical protein